MPAADQSSLNATGDKLSQFTREKYISVETYRKTGDAVRTPVWFVEENGELFFRTDSDTGKMKRIRNNPHVRIAACDIRGKVTGEWVEGEARKVDKETSTHIFDLLKKKYGMMYRMIRFTELFSRSKAEPISLAVRLN
jgi:uncharacterized protein